MDDEIFNIDEIDQVMKFQNMNEIAFMNENDHNLYMFGFMYEAYILIFLFPY